MPKMDGLQFSEARQEYTRMEACSRRHDHNRRQPAQGTKRFNLGPRVTFGKPFTVEQVKKKLAGIA
jgi:hypothetical protein